MTPFFVEENHRLFHVVRLIHFIAESNKTFSFCLSLKVNCEVLMVLTERSDSVSGEKGQVSRPLMTCFRDVEQRVRHDSSSSVSLKTVFTTSLK